VFNANRSDYLRFGSGIPGFIDRNKSKSSPTMEQCKGVFRRQSEYRCLNAVFKDKQTLGRDYRLSFPQAEPVRVLLVSFFPTRAALVLHPTQKKHGSINRTCVKRGHQPSGLRYHPVCLVKEHDRLHRRRGAARVENHRRRRRRGRRSRRTRLVLRRVLSGTLGCRFTNVSGERRPIGYSHGDSSSAGCPM
jgi:hypothetical protein